MTPQVLFDKPQGFITVKDGSNTWTISKDEAKSVFITVDKQTHAHTISTLLTSLLTFIPGDQSINLRYEVKVKTLSGEEVSLFSGKNANLAYDMVERISVFTGEDKKRAKRKK